MAYDKSDFFVTLVPGKIPTRSMPNQGIYKSVQMALIIFFIDTGINWLSFKILFNLQAVLSWYVLAVFSVRAIVSSVLISILFPLGGFTVACHYMLRFLLAAKRRLPFRLVPIFNFCIDRAFMRQVGGGYIFIHRLLMEYFAALTDEDIKQLVAAAETPRRKVNG